MDLRVTFTTSVNRTLANTRQQTDRIGKLQEQASTGKRILTPSDDPTGTITLFANEAQDARLSSYLNNIQSARTTLQVANSGLTDVSSLFNEARQIAIDGAQPANSTTSNEAQAQQIDAILNRLIDVANTRQSNNYIFGGTSTATKPFAVTLGNDGRPQTVTYQGANESSQVNVSAQQHVVTNYVGSEVFQLRQRGPTVYAGGNTGAAPGVGVDSATAQGTLQVRHAATVFAAGSGVQAGTSSAAGDTIIGPAGTHQLNFSGGTVALNGGPAVVYTGFATDLKVTGPNGEVVYLNTSAVPPAYNGTIALTASGTLSVDGGATTTPITFAANQVITNSVTGAVTNVNSTAIRGAGDERLDYTGSYDAFQVLMSLRDDLRNLRGLSDHDQTLALSQRLAELERVQGGVLRATGQQAADLQNLDGIESRAQDVRLETQKLVNDVNGVDIAATVTSLQEQTNLLRMTLQSSASILNQNLLDFLR